MRLRLTLSFVFLVLVSILSVVLITRQSSANELRAFMFRGGVAGLEELVSSLEDYYHHNGTWTGVEDILEATLSGGGRGQGERGSGFGSASQFRLQLADQDGFIVADTQNAISSGRFDQDQLDAAIELVVDDNIGGYLLPQGGQGLNRSDEQYLVNRLNQAAITAAISHKDFFSEQLENWQVYIKGKKCFAKIEMKDVIAP